MRRRELFSSLFQGSKPEEEIIIRPPYYKEESSFHKECNTCEEMPCITFCEENIIVKHSDNTPKLDLSKRGCSYCDECAINCPNEVLILENKKELNVVFEIDMLSCMSWSKSMCFSCKDPCLEDAIEFLGLFRPSINQDKCTSCGFCLGVCPLNAISIKKENNVS